MIISRFINILLAFLILLIGIIGLVTQKTFFIALPNLFFIFKPSLSLDPLSSFFLFFMGISYLGISLFAVDYFKHFTISQQKKIYLFETLFVLAMLFVFLANDTFTFLFAWEAMTLASYFLIVCWEPNKQTRKAGLLYLSMAHLGFFAIVLSFYLLKISPPWTNTIFLLTLIGFGSKAGLFPLHIWLPEAHPAAPSPISALMSGIMLKTAIYGLLRFTFYFLLPYQQPWWGQALISLGLITMLLGVIHAAMQTDMKRLLAYSSMENIGFIATALGLAITFYTYHLFLLTSLALLIVLLHSLNHSLFKSLLFLGTGSILHATGERNLGKLGGLIHKMPWVSACTLIGTLALAGLPFFNGFITEWLYLNTLFHQHTPSFAFNILSSLIIALSVLVFGLAGFVIVKFYGIAFLGQPRELKLTHAYSNTWLERAGLVWLAAGCLLLGLWPNPMITFIQKIIHLISQPLNTAIYTQKWFLVFSPTIAHAHSFSPFILSISLCILLALIWGTIKILSPYAIRRSLAWDCGHDESTPRMQDTAEGFGQPFKQIFSKFIMIKLTLPKPGDANPYYRSQLTEKIWVWFYLPLVNLTTRIASFTKWIQQGRISTYLLFIGLTLLVLLIWVVWA